MTIRPYVLGLVAAVALAAPVHADECRQNCVAIFRFCKQGCIDNYSGIQRRACKIGCRKAKAGAIHQCRRYPQVCPPLE